MMTNAEMNKILTKLTCDIARIVGDDCLFVIVVAREDGMLAVMGDAPPETAKIILAAGLKQTIEREAAIIESCADPQDVDANGNVIVVPRN